MGQNTHEYLKVREAAAIIGVTPRTIRRWIRENKIQAVRINDLVRIPKENITRLILPMGGAE
jgi:excisionase family DNA binding protein